MNLKEIELDLNDCTAFAEMITEAIEKDKSMMEKIYNYDKDISTRYQEKSDLYYRIKQQEVDIKIKESEVVATPEFDSLKNETKRSAVKRLASENERKSLAKLEGDLETLNLHIKQLEMERSSAIHGVAGNRAILRVLGNLLLALKGEDA